MLRKFFVFLSFLSLVGVVGCSSEPDDDPMGGADGGNNNGGADADTAPGEWRNLIDATWVRPPGEGYYCSRVTTTEDLWISEFRAINPEGTHHTVLTVIENPSQPDGEFDCNAGTNADRMIYGSGVGTDPFKFPDGVGVHLPAGTQLLLNLHLFNTTETALNGISGTEIRVVPASEIQHEAEAVLMGPTFTLNIPPGTQTSSGSCTQNGDVTFISVGPHMHQLGTHMKVTAESSIDGTKVIHDAPYTFYEQNAYDLDPHIRMARGDKLRVECTYNNNTGSTVTFGDSSTQEMCFATIYRYPAFGATFGVVCDDGTPF